jgi:hypothetical protein
MLIHRCRSRWHNFVSHLVLGALVDRLSAARQVKGAVDQREMRESLWEIADQAFHVRIILLAQQTDLVA